MLLKRYASNITKTGAVLLLLSGFLSASAQTLQNVEAVDLQDGTQTLKYYFDQSVAAPSHYYIKERDVLVFDFNAKGVYQNAKNRVLDTRLIDNVQNVYMNNRLRSTVNLSGKTDYTVAVKNNVVTVHLTNTAKLTKANWDNLVDQNQKVDNVAPLNDINFMRNSAGAGVIDVFLPSSQTPVNVVEERNKIRLMVGGHTWDPSQNRRIDVTDFATPVSAVEVVNIAGRAYVDIMTHSSYDYTAQQINGNKYRLTVSPKIEAKVASLDEGSALKRDQWSGEPISINFQDIDVRAVLQIIADYTGLNIVVSDTVNSRITIKLTNVPWDQALDTVLLYSGLGQARDGNVIFIAPQDQLTRFEGVNLRTELVQINYADASDLAQVIATRVGAQQNVDAVGAGLSKHGSVSVDRRTNMLIIQDTNRQIKIIKDLIAELDRPVRQVQISAQIVAAFDNFARDLGVVWGGGYQKGKAQGGGSLQSDGAEGGVLGGLDTGINLGASNKTFGLQYMVLGKELQLGLELSAMQTENKGETLASPVVLTTDRQTAYIKQGSEISYSVTSNDGVANVEFKEVVMELNVTPQITPDNKIIMDLLITKDELAGYAQNQEPIIAKKELKTQALVSDGETIVLGGIYEQESSKIDSKVPFFGDLPILGNLFKRQENSNRKAELLIFVTPNIIDLQEY
ncbi:type IV pilus secretin PilQ [Ignatzschineria sp. RMDPL8A]|uniref:type IV pilus secretin PilQ n=1 Tax=Ignatzschineria sp. RMDPL8A TaxID=2999236 RepID=UPI00168F3F23|nr:type IV pilus secretin PilQ [Ignatzschineria sp. RMDPL8A]MDG9730012.1 type IV pilus secretin PilQ [Ignatzschineria sp. RMDPL8A]NLD08198.1 type IV pilus secretin PilQ [Xanthomonadaceae bacterium]